MHIHIYMYVNMQNRGDILFRFSKFSSVPPRCCWAEKIRLPKVSVPPPLPPGEVLIIFLYYYRIPMDLVIYLNRG